MGRAQRAEDVRPRPPLTVLFAIGMAAARDEAGSVVPRESRRARELQKGEQRVQQPLRRARVGEVHLVAAHAVAVEGEFERLEGCVTCLSVRVRAS